MAVLLAASTAMAQRSDDARQSVEGAKAKDPQAIAEAGDASYLRGEYGAAAQHFAEAYWVSKDPRLLLKLHMAFRDGHEPLRARDALAAYLAAAPRAEGAAALRLQLRRLEANYGPAQPFDPKDVAPSAAVGPDEAAADGFASQDSVDPESTLPPNPDLDYSNDTFDYGSRDTNDGDTVLKGPPASLPAPTEDVGEPAPKPREPAKPPPAWLWPSVFYTAAAGLAVAAAITGVEAFEIHAALGQACPGNVCPASASNLQRLADRGRGLALATDVLIGGSLAIAAITTTVVLVGRGKKAESSREAPVEAALGCGPTGCRGTVRVSF